MHRLIVSIVLLSQLLSGAPVLCAQSTAPLTQLTGSIRGTVFDSLSGRVLAGATVELDSPARIVVTDRRGAFTIDSVPVGARQLTFASPELDSIGLFGFARGVTVHAGEQRVDLATPSFSSLYGRLCGPTTEPLPDSAIVFGTVYDARSARPAPNVGVTFRWYAVDAKTIQLLELSREARTDSLGNYGRCGLPADLALKAQATAESAVSGPISSVVGPARIMRRDFFISDELVVDSTRPALRGSGVVQGRVRDERGGPLVNALVVLLTTDRNARTDSLGQFRFAAVPLGTQELSVRQVGHGAIFRTIDVLGATPLSLSMTLPSATVLAAMNVRAERRVGGDQAGFLQRKQIGLGRFLEQAEIAKRFDLTAALQRLPGLNASRSPDGPVVTNTRAGCAPLVVIDGTPRSTQPLRTSTVSRDSSTPEELRNTRLPSTAAMQLDAINARDVIAIEYYASAASVPMQYAYGYDTFCGMLLIWTWFARW